MAEYDARIGAELEIKAYRKATFPMTVTVTETNSGDVFDLTDYSFKMQVKRTFDGVTVVSMDITVTISTGVIEIAKAYASMDLPAGDYVYDLQATYPDASVHPWLWGKMKITDKVT